MMRTEDQFARVHSEAVRFIRFHNKNVWIVPCEDDYRISVIEPKPNELPYGTVALEVGPPIENGVYRICTEIPSSKCHY